MHTLIAAAVEPERGWGNLVAMAVTGLIFYAVVSALGRWRQTQPDTSSAETAAPVLGGVNPQVSASPDPTLDPTSEEVSGEAEKRPTDLDRWARGRVGKPGYRAAVRAGASKFRRSETTIKRALRRAKGGEGA